MCRYGVKGQIPGEWPRAVPSPRRLTQYVGSSAVRLANSDGARAEPISAPATDEQGYRSPYPGDEWKGFPNTFAQGGSYNAGSGPR